MWLQLRPYADRVVAAILLAMAAPLLAVLLRLIRRADGGPGLVRLCRIGKDGQPFGMWKLRTMQAEGVDGTAAGAPLTAANDARITPIGRRLRRHRVDELPQLWNVLRGDMALIGPRPETPEYVDLSDPRWAAVLMVRPGIAGPTQVLVHSWEAAAVEASTAADPYRDEVLPLKLDLDAWYVRKASPRVDLEVLISIVQQFALGVNETAVHRRVARALPDSPARVAARAAIAPHTPDARVSGHRHASTRG